MPHTTSTDNSGRVWSEATACFQGWANGDTGEDGLDGLVRVMTPVLWHVVRSYRLPNGSAKPKSRPPRSLDRVSPSAPSTLPASSQR